MMFRIFCGRFPARAVLTVMALGLIGACSSTSSQSPTAPIEEPAPVPASTPEATAPQPMPELDLGSIAHTVFFDFDAAVLSMEGQADLRKHAAWLRDNPDRSLVVEGHADERGTREYNLALGQSRGEVVKAFLATHGVNNARIEVVSYGEERPASTVSNERGWSKNRRAFLRYESGADLARN